MNAAKNPFRLNVLTLTLLLSTLNPQLSTVLAQGPLTPPGAPAPTMKSLDQIEPRIAINSVNTPGDADSLFKITQPGSYYLTGNINGVAGKHGIEIAAQYVTLDLCGFALIGTTSSLSGVFSATAFGVTIINGSVGAWGDSGIETQLVAGRIENVIAYNNGKWGIRSVLNGNASRIVGCEVHFNGSLAAGMGGGISTDNGALVVECYASNNFGDGIFVSVGSRVVNCASNDNQGDGIQASVNCCVTGCTTTGNGAKGILIDAQGKVTDCDASQNDGDGIFTLDHSNITNCVAAANLGNGIVARAGCEVAQCVANYNFGDGILLNGDGATARSCTVYFNGQGLIVMTTANGINATALGCSVLDCTASLNLIDGIRVAGRCRVVGNNCHANGFAGADGAGIHATSSDNHIEGNTVTGADRGIDIDGIGCLIIRNTAKVNTTNYSIVANNKVGVIVAAPNSVAINGSTGGAGVGTTDPWANFSY